MEQGAPEIHSWKIDKGICQSALRKYKKLYAIASNFAASNAASSSASRYKQCPDYGTASYANAKRAVGQSCDIRPQAKRLCKK